MTKFGYVAACTRDCSRVQNVDLGSVGCIKIRLEPEEAGVSRPVWAGLLADLQPGDQVVILGLAEVGWSASEFLAAVKELDGRDVTLCSLADDIDTATPAGRLAVRLLESAARSDREQHRIRSKAGVIAARLRSGYCHGRPRKLSPEQIDSAHRMISDGVTQRMAARHLGVARGTLWKAMKTSAARLDLVCQI